MVPPQEDRPLTSRIVSTLLLALGLLACQSPPVSEDPAEDPPEVAGEVGERGEEPVREPIGPTVAIEAPARGGGASGGKVITIGGEVITSDAVLDALRESDGEVFEKVVQRLMIRSVVRREQAKHGVEVPLALIEADIKADRSKAEKVAQLQYQMTLTKLLEAQGKAMADFDRQAREKAIHLRTLERLVRYEQLTRGLLKVRHIVVKTEAEATGVRDKLIAGADFTVLAKQHSHCPTARYGGVLAMVVPGIYANADHPQVERAIWALQVGDVSPVVKARTGYHIFEGLYRQPPLEGSYRQVAARVEASLKAHAVMREEETWWLDLIRKRYPIQQHFK